MLQVTRPIIEHGWSGHSQCPVSHRYHPRAITPVSINAGFPESAKTPHCIRKRSIQAFCEWQWNSTLHQHGGWRTPLLLSLRPMKNVHMCHSLTCRQTTANITLRKPCEDTFWYISTATWRHCTVASRSLSHLRLCLVSSKGSQEEHRGLKESKCDLKINHCIQYLRRLKSWKSEILDRFDFLLTF